MSDNAPIGFFFVIFLLMLTAILVLAYQRDTLKEDAVKHGYAEWVVDTAGNTKWKWKEKKYEQ